MRVESAILSILGHIPGLLSVQVTHVGCVGLNIRITVNVVLVSSSSNTLVANLSAAVESGRVGNLTVDPSSLLFGKAALLCGNSLDIIYLVDGSGSVGANNFEKVKLFIKKAVSGFVIGPAATQVGVIQYSSKIRQEFSMNSFQTVSGLLGAIDAMEYMQGGTLTGRAIRYASKYGFSVFDGARRGVPKVLVVVTDGVSSDEVAIPALEAQRQGIFVYAIGVSNYDAEQLQKIASTNESSAMVDNFNLLDSVRNTLLTSVCDVTPPVYASVILNTQFTTALRNPGSAEYTNLSVRVKTEVSRLFLSIVGFRSVSVVDYQAAAGNRVKVVLVVFVSEFAVTSTNQTFISITHTGSIGSISVDASSAFVVGEETVPVVVSLVVRDLCNADLLNPDSATYRAFVTQVESAVLSILGNIPAVLSVRVTGIRCSGLNVQVTISVTVTSTSSNLLITTVSTAVRQGSIGNLTVNADSFLSGMAALVCQNPLDIIFLIDGSGSVGASNFEKVKQLMQKTITGFDIGPNTTQVGVIQYSSTVRQEFSMNTFHTNEAVSTVIDEIGYIRGGTLTGKAIRYVSRYGFAERDGARPGVPKVLIVVTDGVSSDAVKQSALEAQQKGIFVFAIGVAGYDMAQLEQIASSNRSLAVVDNFNLLDSLRNSLLTGVCDVPSPVVISLTLTIQYSTTMRNQTSIEFGSISTSLATELSRIFVDIPGFQGLTIVGLQPTPTNQVKATITVFVAQFSTTTMKVTFISAVQTGSLGSISVNTSSALVIEQDATQLLVSFVITDPCNADFLNSDSAAYMQFVIRVENALLSILGNIPGILSVKVTSISCSGLYIRVTISLGVVSASSGGLVTAISTDVSSGSVGDLTVDPTSFISGEEALVCRTPLDIILLLDGSGSVGAYNFEKVKQFSQKLVETFDIGPSATQIGVIQYSTRVRQEFSMNSFQSKETLSNAVDDIAYMRGGTLTGRAIRYVSRYGFARSDGARPGVAKVLIVVTDGISYDGVATPAYKARQKGILVYAIGVSGYDLTQLEQIASNNRTLAVVDNFNLLDSLRNTLLTGVCDAVPPVFVCVTLTTQFSIQLRNPDSSEFSSITSALIAEVSQLFTSIVGFQGATVVGYQPAPDNQVKVSIAVFVAEFAATTMKQTFVVAVSTGNLG
ncbi:collagen alpha-1(XII) chain-like, partial [Branchiostoma floridae]|uniref:Collagen alpha-1(XII) chain-like n=1 Tax=Branchiostoma floridae TaxID=7739 RepID=A0A9J7KGK2_BRAFL